MNYKQVLSVSTDIAYLLLKYGAEVYRAEQSIKYICTSYGFTDIDVLAIPSSVIVTISIGDDYITKTKRIKQNIINLEKIEMLIDLSRYICENKPAFEEIEKKIEDI